MNKKIIIMLIIIGTLLFLNSNKNTNELISNEKTHTRSPNNVKIKIIENSISSTGVTILVTDNNKYHYAWGEQFSIQKKVDGEWQNLKYLTDLPVFSLIGYGLDKNNQLIQKIDWTDYYGELSIGKYRIIKQVYDNGYISLYSDEFEI